MKNFRNYFKKEKWTKGLLFSLLPFFISFSSHAGSIREVSQNIERVKSIEPPFQFAVIGDSRDGEKVYTQFSALKERGGYFHYVWISVQREKMEGEVVDLEGQIQDRFVIE